MCATYTQPFPTIRRLRARASVRPARRTFMASLCARLQTPRRQSPRVELAHRSPSEAAQNDAGTNTESRAEPLQIRRSVDRGGPSLDWRISNSGARAREPDRRWAARFACRV